MNDLQFKHYLKHNQSKQTCVCGHGYKKHKIIQKDTMPSENHVKNSV